MNKKDIDTTQKQYEELGYKIKDIQFQQTKINNNKPSSTNNSQTNNFLEENVKTKV